MGFTHADIPDLEGKTIIVTGANSGIGLEAARAFATRRARVILACRDPQRGAAAMARLLRETPYAQLEVLRLELASLAAIRRFAADVAARHGRLDVLVNNAGLMAVPRQLTEDGFELQIGVNHFGHFALTGLLMPLLLATPEARVVTVTSLVSILARMQFDDLDGARSYHKWTAYLQSKLANLLFCFELARLLSAANSGTRSLACHPGYAATNLHRSGPTRSTEGWFLDSANRLLAQSARQGALPTLYAATAPAAHNGEFIGPLGLFGRAGAPGPVKAPARATDVTDMQRLWRISVERTGVDYAALTERST